MIEPPAIVREPPPGVDSAAWADLTDGQRLRWLKAHQFELHLSREQFLQLSQLPFWAMYGQEHGLPAELFNEQGFLLPKYRPGGARFDEFQRWRRCHRLASWRQLRFDRRLQRFLHGPGAFLGLLWVAVGVFGGKLLAPILQARFGSVPILALEGAILLAHCLVGAVLALLVLAVISGCIVRKTVKAIGAPTGD